MKKNIGAIVYLILTQALSGVVLFIWPFMVIASLMSMAGPNPERIPKIFILFGFLFHIWVIIYPLPYFIFVIMSWVALNKNKVKGAIVLTSVTPGLTIIFFVGLVIIRTIAGVW